MPKAPHINCRHFEVKGEVTRYGACSIRAGGCVTCCLLCGLRETAERVAPSGWKYQAPGCKRACKGVVE